MRASLTTRWEYGKDPNPTINFIRAKADKLNRQRRTADLSMETLSKFASMARLGLRRQVRGETAA